MKLPSFTLSLGQDTTPIVATPTEWAERERNGLLTVETNEWRGKRHQAENPEMESVVLKQFADDVYDAYLDNDRSAKLAVCLLAEAVAAHPNTPPKTLRFLLNLPAPFAYYCPLGFCRNPHAPELGSGSPDFWGTLVRIENSSGEALLRETFLPPSVAVALSESDDESVAQSAHLHTSLAGEIRTQAEGRIALTAFWRAFCLTESLPSCEKGERFRGQAWHAEMVELGLAPPWALGEASPISPMSPPPSSCRTWRTGRTIRERIGPALSPLTSPDLLVQLARESSDLNSPFVRRLICRHPNAPPGIALHARHGFVTSAMHKYSLLTKFHYDLRTAHENTIGKLPFNRTEFVRFVARLHSSFDLSTLYYMGQSPAFIDRLNAALALPITDDPYPDDLWDRSPLLLLRHLADDGNRFVRWAAQTRLADPDFVFTWLDDTVELIDGIKTLEGDVHT